jgi:hypothetical protein
VITDLIDRDPESQFYLSDLGLLRHYQGRTEEGLEYLWEAFRMNASNGYGFRKLAPVLIDARRMNDLYRATLEHAAYKNNMNDPLVQQVLGSAEPSAVPPGGP